MTAAAPNLDRVRGALAARQAGEGWSARCPAHEDRSASLSIAAGRKGGVVVKCHAGCSVEDVVAAAGLTMLDLAPEKQRRAAVRRQVAAYPYADEAGELLFEMVRFDPKDFRQRRPDGNGGWTWNLNGTRRVPYQLPEVIVAVAEGRRVFIAEGHVTWPADHEDLWDDIEPAPPAATPCPDCGTRGAGLHRRGCPQRPRTITL